MSVYVSVYKSPLGNLTMASRGDKIIGLWMDGQKYFLGKLKEETVAKDDLEVFALCRRWLDDYFSGKNPPVDKDILQPEGSEFRQSVWNILLEIPYGATTTYGEIAKKLAREKDVKSMSRQAVGGRVGHNPISIIIPCHRVVGRNGSLTGYAGGIDKKISLLKHENADMSKLYRPAKSTAP